MTTIEVDREDHKRIRILAAQLETDMAGAVHFLTEEMDVDWQAIEDELATDD